MTSAGTTTVQPTDTLLTPARASRRRAVTFTRHYLEMVVAMVAGMVLLDPPVKAGLELLGARPDTWRDGAPELSLLLMGVTMTVPMAAWMRVRKHRWQPTLEMCAAMLAPTAAAMIVLATGLTDAVSAVFAAEHTAMFVAMLAVMLWRREEYNSGRHNNAGILPDGRGPTRPATEEPR